MIVLPICVEASSGIIFISRVYLLVEVRKGKYSLYNGRLLDPIHGVSMRPIHGVSMRPIHGSFG